MKELLNTNDTFTNTEMDVFINIAKEPNSDLIYYEDYVSHFSKIN